MASTRAGNRRGSDTPFKGAENDSSGRRSSGTSGGGSEDSRLSTGSKQPSSTNPYIVYDIPHVKPGSPL
jgi:hypothetical protein